MRSPGPGLSQPPPITRAQHPPELRPSQGQAWARLLEDGGGQAHSAAPLCVQSLQFCYYATSFNLTYHLSESRAVACLYVQMYNVYIVRYSAICVGSEGVFMLGCFILFIAIMTSESVEV